MSRAPLVGIDIVPIANIADSLKEFGDRFLSRIFTAQEIDYCRSRAAPAALESFAARFAAKEAAIKALGAADWGLDWRSIEVVRAPNGACTLRLQGAAGDAARKAGCEQLELSMSHAGEYAIALVVGVREGNT